MPEAVCADIVFPEMLNTLLRPWREERSDSASMPFPSKRRAPLLPMRVLSEISTRESEIGPKNVTACGKSEATPETLEDRTTNDEDVVREAVESNVSLTSFDDRIAMFEQ